MPKKPFIDPLVQVYAHLRELYVSSPTMQLRAMEKAKIAEKKQRQRERKLKKKQKEKRKHAKETIRIRDAIQRNPKNREI